jgi:hypothetical protein
LQPSSSPATSWQRPSIFPAASQQRARSSQAATQQQSSSCQDARRGRGAPNHPEVASVLAEMPDALTGDGPLAASRSPQKAPHMALHRCHISVCPFPIDPLHLEEQPARSCKHQALHLATQAATGSARHLKCPTGRRSSCPCTMYCHNAVQRLPQCRLKADARRQPMTTKMRPAS